VQLEHAGVANLLRFYAAVSPDISPGDAFLQSMSFFFGECSACCCMSIHTLQLMLWTVISEHCRSKAKAGPSGEVLHTIHPADGSVMDIWWPLSMGGTIVIPTAEQLQDPEAMRGIIRRHSVVFLMIVPSHFQASVCACCLALSAGCQHAAAGRILLSLVEVVLLLQLAKVAACSAQACSQQQSALQYVTR
jgi:hypothetical protein